MGAIKPEDAIADAVKRTGEAIAAKYRSCANDDDFLANGEVIVGKMIASGAKGSPVRLAMRAVLLQAAHDAESVAGQIKVVVVTKDKEPTT